MRLLAKYNRVNLVTTIIVMLITGIIYYQAISLILTNQVDKELVVEENEIFDFVSKNHQLPQVFESNDLQISFIKASPGSVTRQFINTLYRKSKFQGHNKKHRHHDDEAESGRGLISAVNIGDQYYKIQIVESKVETEDLISIIFFITIGVIVLLLLVLFITNRLILNRLWKPFHNLLNELHNFNIADNKAMPLLNTNIDEFKELNQVVISMSSRVKRDYKDLKTFTENASHELLTPIAVINSKLDTLIQTDNFSEQQSKLLNDLYTSVSRLTRINQSLLLLVKIENSILQDKKQINLCEQTEELLIQFEDIFQDKKLQVTTELTDKVIQASPYLVDVLLNNLMSNAIRHNYAGGLIKIILTNENLIIKNTGDNNPLAIDQIFKRFHKSSQSEGTGLGLTISQQICENFGFKLEYKFQEHLHTFIVKF